MKKQLSALLLLGALALSVSPAMAVLRFNEDAPSTDGDAGIQVLTVRKDTPGTSTAGTDGDYASLQTDPQGRLLIRTLYTADMGLTPFRDLGATNTGTSILSAAAAICELTISNGDSAGAFVKLYDKATAATSSDTPILEIYVPTVATVSVPLGGACLHVAAGLSARAVTEATDAGTTGAASNKIVVNGLKK